MTFGVNHRNKDWMHLLFGVFGVWGVRPQTILTFWEDSSCLLDLILICPTNFIILKGGTEKNLSVSSDPALRQCVGLGHNTANNFKSKALEVGRDRRNKLNTSTHSHGPTRVCRPTRYEFDILMGKPHSHTKRQNVITTDMIFNDKSQLLLALEIVLWC